MTDARTISYRPAGPTVRRFHQSKAFVRGLMGPIGSGKSTACVLEILRRAQMQAPSADGVRYSRWAVIRNSFPELRSTTIKTWHEWVPQAYGKMTWDSPLVHHLKAPGFDCEVLFMALDKPEDARKLLSLELTGAWINEAREVEKAILDALTGRIGRYPGKMKGGCTWSGVIMDTNAPNSESWWFRMAEQDTPEGWEFFKQPSGVAAEAENLANLPPQYYRRAMGGKEVDWIKVYVHGEYGFLVEGAAVFPNFRDSVHTASEAFRPAPGLPMEIGVDFGLTPAAVLGQRMPDGQWRIFDEIVTQDTGVIRFAEHLTAYVQREYPECPVAHGWGDPHGDARAENDEKTALDIMRQHTPWRWRPAPGNDLTIRLEVVKNALNRLIDGKPGLLLSPRCAMLRKGFTGGYHRKFVKSSGGTVIHDLPAKNEFSHPHDGLQYLLLGGGEQSVVMAKPAFRKRERAYVAEVDYPLFG